MSNYTKVTNFTAKDSLPSGNTGKVVRGSEIDTEFTNIQTAVNSKADTASPTFTGTVTIPTAAITGGSITGITDLAIADGGTGASTAQNARNNLLPSQSTHAGKYLKTDGTDVSWDALDISTADITGTLPIANGGTGATSASAARTALGVAIGTDVQAYDAQLADIAGLTPTDGNFIVGDGTNFVAESGATARTSLGLGSIATQAASNVSITGGSISGITDLAVADGGTGASDASGARTNLGLGSIATQAANNVSITGGSISGITDLAVADGGTGASDASGARTNLGLVIGTDVQAYDAELAAIAGLTSAADKVPYFTGAGTAAVTDFTSFGRSLVDDADASAARSTLGLVIGTNVQAYDAELAAIAGLTSAADKLPYFTGAGTASTTDFTSFGRSLVDDADASAARTTLGLVIGTNVQAYDAQLADVAGLTPTDNGVIIGNGTNFVVESGATLKTSLGLTIGTDVQAYDSNLTSFVNAFTLPTTDGTNGQALTTNGSGTISWSTVAGAPGGSNTQLQYNNNGAFGGASGLVTDGTNLTLNGQADLRFADSDSSNWVAFQAPATISSNVTWTLPSADGTSGQVLSTDGSGTLSWATASGGGGGGGGTSVTVTQITATASQTTFNVTYTVGQISVYLNGALLASADYTATNGTSVVLGTGAASGDIFTAVVYSTVTGLTINTASPFNTWVGYQAGNANTTGVNNTAVGYQALDANTTGQRNIAFGGNALGAVTTGNYNVGIGYFAGRLITTASANTAVGDAALYTNTGSNNTSIGFASLFSNTTGENNVALGYNALNGNTTASNNTAIGYQALLANTTGANNTAVGYGALDANTIGISNTAIGTEALGSNTTGKYNVAVGSRHSGNYGGALEANTTGSFNTALGTGTLVNNTTGEYNVALGARSLENNSTASNNIGIGFQALSANTTGTVNVAVGYLTLDACTTGSYNAALGGNALGGLTTANDNVAIGYNAGAYLTTLTTGSANTLLGAYTRTSASGSVGQYVIGYDVAGQADNNVTIGNSAGKIYNAYTVNATWTQTSDERLKRNIQNDTLGLSFVNRLRPVKYQWKPSNEIDPSLPYYNPENKRDTETVMHGLVAQEVKAALDAEGVTTFAGWDVGSDTIQAISREMFITPLIKAIQELSAKCDALQAEVNQLKGN